MKKPRLIELEESSTITSEKYQDLLNHGENSGLYYCSNKTLTVKELKEKLYKKGYPEGSIYVDDESSIIEHNIVEEVVEFLERIMVLDDDQYLRNFIEDRVSSGKGKSVIERDLFYKGFDRDSIEEAFEEVFDEEEYNSELMKIIEREYEILSSKNLSDYEIKMRVTRKAASKGFSFEDISENLEKFLTNEYF